MTSNKALQFSLVKLWLILSVFLSALIVPINSASLKLKRLPTNLQSGSINYKSKTFNTDSLFVNFGFNLPNTDKNQLTTDIAYPEIYKMQISQLKVNTWLSSQSLSINLKQTTLLSEILKLDRNLIVPLSVGMIDANKIPIVATNQFILIAVKMVLIFAIMGLLLGSFNGMKISYLKFIQLDPKVLDSRRSNLLVLLGLIILSGLYSLCRGQDFNWDLRNYHFYNPYAFLSNRLLFDIEPADVHSYFSPILDIFNYLLIRNLTPMLSAFVLGAMSGLFAFAVYKIIQLIYSQDTKLVLIRRLNPSLYMASILWSLLLATTGFANLTQIGTTMNENFIAIPIMWSYYWLLRYQNIPESKFLWFSGFLIGIALGLKLTAIVFVLALVISFAALRYRKIFRLNTIGFGLAIIVGFLLVNGVWMFKMYHVFGNPFFPSLGSWFNPEMAANFNRDTTFLPKDLLHGVFLPFYLLFPSRLTCEQTIVEPRYALVAFLLVVSIFKAKDFFNNKLLRLLLINLIVGYVLWEVIFSIQRYTVALEALCGILSVVLLNYLTYSKDNAHKILLILGLFVLLISKAGDFDHISYAHKFTDLGVSDTKLPQNALVIYGSAPLAYLSEPLGSSNIYMNRPSDINSKFNEMRKQSALVKFIASRRDIFLVDKTSKEMLINSAIWLNDYSLKIGECFTFNNTARQIMCRLIYSDKANVK